MSQVFTPDPSPWARAVAEMACQIKNVKIQERVIGKPLFVRQVTADSTGYCNPSPECMTGISIVDDKLYRN